MTLLMSDLDEYGRPPKQIKYITYHTNHSGRVQSLRRQSTETMLLQILGKARTIREMCEMTGVNYNTIRGVLSKLYTDGKIEKFTIAKKKRYQIAK